MFFLGPSCQSSSLHFSSIPSRTILLVLCRVSVFARFSGFLLPPGAFITGRSILPRWCAGILGRGLLYCAICVTVENTPEEDGEQLNTFRGFQSDQEEEITQWLPPIVFGPNSVMLFLIKPLAPFLYAFCSRYGALGPPILGLLVWLLKSVVFTTSYPKN